MLLFFVSMLFTAFCVGLVVGSLHLYNKHTQVKAQLDAYKLAEKFDSLSDRIERDRHKIAQNLKKE